MPPIHGPSWEYRHRARLSARYVVKKGGMLIGFHERKSSYVADMTSCSVLPRRISDLLPKLRALIGGLTVRDRLPQIELAVGDGENGCARARVADPRSARTGRRIGAARLRGRARRAVLPPTGRTRNRGAAAAERSRHWRTRYRSSISSSPSRPPSSRRSIRRSNRVLVRRAIGLIDPRPGERIADFFCGIGNFTLPLARRCGTAVGIEGSASLVDRATQIAGFNGLAGKATFQVANLFAATPESFEALGPLDKILVDPPREGAIALVKALPGDGAPERIVYVSCNPATLARDASVLVHDHGYDLAAGRRGQHVPAHVARRIHRAVRALGSVPAQKNRGDVPSPRCPLYGFACQVSRAARKHRAAG
jgi:23S rRNA (uracil1939-C5)-methyltransferase